MPVEHGPTIRAEQRADHDAVHRVVSTAFESEAESVLVDDIRASEWYVPEMALVATIDGEVVGHVMISGTTIRLDDGGSRKIAMLAPLAVVPESQRRGIGGALVRAVTSIADDRGEPLVVVEGDPAYYSRFGFEHSLPLGVELPLPGWAPPEAGQLLRLATYDTKLRGTVIYPPAFDGFD